MRALLPRRCLGRHPEYHQTQRLDLGSGAGACSRLPPGRGMQRTPFSPQPPAPWCAVGASPQLHSVPGARSEGRGCGHRLLSALSRCGACTTHTRLLPLASLWDGCKKSHQCVSHRNILSSLVTSLLPSWPGLPMSPDGFLGLLWPPAHLSVNGTWK